MDTLDDKLDEVIDKLDNLKIKNKDNKYVFFYKKVFTKLDDILDIISDYQIDNKSNLEITEELEKEIKDAKHVRDTINIFLPFMLYYEVMGFKY